MDAQEPATAANFFNEPKRAQRVSPARCSSIACRSASAAPRYTSSVTPGCGAYNLLVTLLETPAHVLIRERWTWIGSGRSDLGTNLSQAFRPKLCVRLPGLYGLADHIAFRPVLARLHFVTDCLDDLSRQGDGEALIALHGRKTTRPSRPLHRERLQVSGCRPTLSPRSPKARTPPRPRRTPRSWSVPRSPPAPSPRRCAPRTPAPSPPRPARCRS